jgi:NAD(P)-dependent dehydrogenase (short-subunit alcohol dehydrogenase family)
MMAQKLLGDFSAVSGTSANEARTNAMALHPLGRFGEAADVANAVVFLACDDSAFMTGSELVVDGGMTAR